MAEILTGRDASPKYAHLPAADRQAIVEILADTKPDATDYFRSSSPTPAR
jgi:hypothetical protein